MEMHLMVARVWRSLIKTFYEWLEFEEQKYQPQTLYFSPYESHALTEKELLEWAYETRDNLLDKRLSFVKSIRNIGEELVNLGESEDKDLGDGITRLCDSLTDELQKQFDALTLLIESTECADTEGTKKAYEILAETEEKIRTLMSNFSYVFSTLVKKGFDVPDKLLT